MSRQRSRTATVTPRTTPGKFISSDNLRGYANPQRPSVNTPERVVLRRFTLYETRTRMYIVGENCDATKFRILKIDRTLSSDLAVVEDEAVYSKEQIQDVLSMVEVGNKSTGGLYRKMSNICGILGHSFSDKRNIHIL